MARAAAAAAASAILALSLLPGGSIAAASPWVLADEAHGLCVFVRSELAPGRGGGELITSLRVTAAQSGRCRRDAGAAALPAGNLRVQDVLQIRRGPKWFRCHAATLRVSRGRSAVLSQTTSTGIYPPCGAGTYRNLGLAQARVAGVWTGGRIDSPPQFLPAPRVPS